MRYLSLFSGIGGFELGIQQAHEQLCNADGSKNGRIKEDKEGDKGQRLLTSEGQDVSSEKRPTSERTTDRTYERPLCIGYSEIDKYATQIYQKHFPEHKNYGDITKIKTDELPDFDLLVGGFPCQSFSIAGKRLGFQDTRGTMFFEIARILLDKKPRLFLLENVKGLLSHEEGRTFETIIWTLDELGYDLQWQVLNSKNFGVPQNRERVFIVGHLRGTSRPQVFPFGSTDEATDGNPEISQLNNPVHSNDRVYGTDGIAPTLNTMQGGNRQPFMAIKYGQNNPDRNGNTSPDMFTLKTGGANAGITDGMKIRRLTPTECERLQGFPDGWTEGVSDTQRYRCLGNAVTVNVIQAIMEKLLWNL